MSQSEQLRPSPHPVMVAIAGCSGSGKTTLARKLAQQLDATLFPLDLYYRDLSRFPLDTRDKRNFDHPDSLESELFVEHIRNLSEGRPIQRPVYDFKTHSRVAGAFETVVPGNVVIVEGILALHYPELLPLYNLSIYVDAPPELCLKRRIRRDMRERGRTEASIRAQFTATTQPMAELYVIPSRRHASLTVSGTIPLEDSLTTVRDALHHRHLL